MFFGNHSTGRITIAKLYGQILADLGLVSNEEGKESLPKDRGLISDVVVSVIIKNPADFVGRARAR